MTALIRLAFCLAVIGLSGPAAQAATGTVDTGAADTIATVRARGVLLCGVIGNNAGFSLPDSQGVMRGIDADSCRALAAAVLGDAGKVRFVPLTALTRLTSLQSGDVDVVFANVTFTLTRESNSGLEFLPPHFYDGQGFMVRRSSGIASARKLDGASICVPPGSTAERNLQDYFGTNGMRFEPVIIDDANELRRSFLAGRCDVYSIDTSILAAFRFQQGPAAADFAILPEIISKEPLSGVVRKGDERWLDLATWVHYAQVTAEELGVTSANIDSLAGSKLPETRRLLGLEGDLGQSLGVDNRWAYNVIKQVGNYGQMWERNITPLGIPRGINNLWTKGGLQYAPPMR